MCGTVVISQQQALGITIQSNGSVVSTLNVVQGDYIGTDVTGLRALGNSIGVNLFGSASNTIGGTNPGSGNVISGNTGVGVSIDEGTNEVVQGNLIGTDKSGIAALPNGYAGVLLGGNAGPTTGDTIGGTIAGSGNVIAFNTAGVVVAQATGGAILGNSIFGNASNPNSGSTGLGIDLGNDRATPNTPGGPHVGPNNLQNFPVITAVTVAGGNTTVSGTLNSAPTTAFRLEFFANPAADPSGFGQGKIFLGALPSVTTDAQGNASFGFNAPDDLTAQFLAANATDLAGNTSEFGRDFPQADTPLLVPTTTAVAASPNPATVGQAVTLSASIVRSSSGTTPTGTVIFTVDGQARTPVAVAPTGSNFVATLNVAGLAVGTHTITAACSGDSTFALSTSSSFVEAVNPAP